MPKQNKTPAKGTEFSNMVITGNHEVRNGNIYVEVKCDCYKSAPYYIRLSRLTTKPHCGHHDNRIIRKNRIDMREAASEAKFEREMAEWDRTNVAQINWKEW